MRAMWLPRGAEKVFFFYALTLPGSLHVPLFIEDTATDLLTVAKKQVVLGFGGLWLGQRLTKENDAFLEQVLGAAGGDKATPLLVACNEGLR